MVYVVNSTLNRPSYLLIDLFYRRPMEHRCGLGEENKNCLEMKIASARQRKLTFRDVVPFVGRGDRLDTRIDRQTDRQTDSRRETQPEREREGGERGERERRRDYLHNEDKAEYQLVNQYRGGGGGEREMIP